MICKECGQEKPNNGHGYNPNCGCPGCQYLHNAERAYETFGPVPVIGTFEAIEGDFGRDCDKPESPIRRMMSDGRWWPYFGVRPRME
jgi:hypothetical protein